MRLTQRVRSFFREEAWDFPEHERPVVPGSPATPEHVLTLRIAYALVAILVGLTAGLGNALLMVNITELQTGLALSSVQAAWLPTAYAMTNISANLLLIKFRQQYGLRVFTQVALSVYALLSLTYLLTADHWLTLAIRAASGFVAAALTPLSLFYVMQALPGRWRVRGLILGLGISHARSRSQASSRHGCLSARIGSRYFCSKPVSHFSLSPPSERSGCHPPSESECSNLWISSPFCFWVVASL
ncbi:MFS transporter [Agrobacterium radiobacter]